VCKSQSSLISTPRGGFWLGIGAGRAHEGHRWFWTVDKPSPHQPRGGGFWISRQIRFLRLHAYAAERHRPPSAFPRENPLAARARRQRQWSPPSEVEAERAARCMRCSRPSRPLLVPSRPARLLCSRRQSGKNCAIATANHTSFCACARYRSELVTRPALVEPVISAISSLHGGFSSGLANRVLNWIADMTMVRFSNRPDGVQAPFRQSHRSVDVRSRLGLLFGTAPWPFQHGIRGTMEQSFVRPYRQQKRQFQQTRTHLIPSREGHPFHRLVELVSSYRNSLLPSCAAGALVHRNSVSSTHDAVHKHGQPACQRTTVFFIPRAGDLHGPRLEP